MTTEIEKKYLRFDWIAWIPCLVGRLSFTHMESGLGTDRVTVNFQPDKYNNSERYVALFARKNWQDTKDTSADGQFSIFVTATASNNSSMTGAVYITPTSNEGNCWTDSISFLEKMVVARNELPKYTIQLEKKQQILEGMVATWDELSKKLNASSSNEDKIFKVSFVIERTGITYLQLDDKETSTGSESWLIPRQAFYFLKYCLHKHKHHPDELDSMTTTHRNPDERTKIPEVLLHDLKNALVDLKRDLIMKGLASDHNIPGITSYTQSLLNSLRKDNLLTAEQYDIENTYFKNIRDSGNAINRVSQQKKINENNSANAGRQVVVILIAFLGPIVITNNIGVGVNQEEATAIIEKPFLWPVFHWMLTTTLGNLVYGLGILLTFFGVKYYNTKSPTLPAWLNKPLQAYARSIFGKARGLAISAFFALMTFMLFYFSIGFITESNSVKDYKANMNAGKVVRDMPAKPLTDSENENP